MRGDSVRHLFVYGTLKRNGTAPLVERLAKEAKWRGTASLAGRIVDLGAYPGLLPATDPQQIVHGELWELPEDPSLLTALDEYEGADYSRIICTANDEDGVRLWCWTYLYQAHQDF